MKLLIIRHAEPDYEHNTLTEKGFREAEILSHRMVNTKIDKIYSSPVQRALLTAQPTAEKKQMDMEVVDWLHEFRGGLVDDDGKRRIPWNLPPRFWTPKRDFYDISTWGKEEHMVAGGAEAEYLRVGACFDEMMSGYGYRREGVLWKCDRNLDVTLAFFCHFALGMVLVSHLTQISPVMLWQTMFLPTSSVTTFVTEEREEGEVVFKCMQLGDTSHLLCEGEPVSTSGLFPEFIGGEGTGAKL